MTFTCKPGEADKALVGAAQAAVWCNERFGDNLDPKHAMQCVQRFIAQCPHMKCGTCGWRSEETGKCGLHNISVGAGDRCDHYRHEFKVVDDCTLNGGIIT